MKNTIPTLTNGVVHYMAHHLHAFVKFSEIDKIKNMLKRSRNKILLVVDHKQKILQMKYREGQIEYYGKKGMSFLGTMVVHWVVDKDNIGWYEYLFFDYVFKGYSGQDHIQVASALKVITQEVKKAIPLVDSIIIQSDNSNCFASQQLIPFIHYLNEENIGSRIAIERWVFTEAQTGRGRLDTYFSYINLVLKSFVEDDNDMTLEEHIIQALGFRGGIAGTTGFLLNCSNFTQHIIQGGKFNTSTVKRRETHDIWWKSRHEVHIQASSSLTPVEIIGRSKLNEHHNTKWYVPVLLVSYSSKPALLIKDKHSSHVELHSAITCSKGKALQQALSAVGAFTHPNTTTGDIPSITSLPDILTIGWAKHPWNDPNRLPHHCILKLMELYNMGNQDKKNKVSAERSHQIIVQDILFDQWDLQLDVTIPKIKAFFSMTPARMSRTLQTAELVDDDVLNAEMELVQCENADESLLPMDVEI